MRALVTGAAGFIGSHLIERLAAAGHRARGLVRSPAQAAGVRRLGGEPVVGDVTDFASLRAAAAGADVVFHLAARVSDWGGWAAFAAATVGGTENALRAAAAAGAGRFVLMSTVAVYDNRVGDRLHVVPEGAPHNGVGDRLLGYYSRAKVRAEAGAWEYHRRGELAVSALRPAFVYGPRDRVVLPRLLEFLAAPYAFWIGGRDPVQDPIYVTDVADCAIAAAAGPAGEAYNVAPAEEIRLRHFLGLLCDATGIRPPARTVPHAVIAPLACCVEAAARLVVSRNPPFLTRAGVATVTTDRHYTPAKAIRDLGWRPAVSLEEGVRRTAEWLRSEPEFAHLLGRAGGRAVLVQA